MRFMRPAVRMLMYGSDGSDGSLRWSTPIGGFKAPILFQSCEGTESLGAGPVE